MINGLLPPTTAWLQAAIDALEGEAVFPISAWTQAVIVCLFAVTLLAFLVEMRRQQREWREFLRDNNKNWQDWLAARDADVCKALADVTASLRDLRGLLISHDRRVDDRIDRIVDTSSDHEQKTKPLAEIEREKPNGRASLRR